FWTGATAEAAAVHLTLEGNSRFGVTETETGTRLTGGIRRVCSNGRRRRCSSIDDPGRSGNRTLIAIRVLCLHRKGMVALAQPRIGGRTGAGRERATV